ncbi:MAG TPA: aldehyde dehydrogenase family protein [Phycisphaerae bacterium]|nr:aldehyde dehydrogenase family protein [Phycisphaerae bacterium]
MKINWPTKMCVGGKWVAASGGKTLPIINPATGEKLTEVALANARDVDAAVVAARKAFDEGPWPRMEPLERGRYLWRMAEGIRKRLDELSMTDTLNMGKPIRDTKGWDTPVSAQLFESYAGLCDKIAGKCWGSFPESVQLQIREPVGVVASIAPWNYPLTNAVIKIAPALACGNCMVFKPSELTPLTALMLGEIAEEIGLPPGVLNVINGYGGDVGAALVAHSGVDKVSFTGRLQTGVSIMKAAADGIKGVTLELGGKTPNIVFPDAPLDNVVNDALTMIFVNMGQVCVAASRLIVHESIHDELVERMVAKTKTLRQGDPTDERNHLGCVAAASHLKTIESYVERAKAEKARLCVGGKRPDDPALARGTFYLPTIFDHVTPDMTISREEVFGPVLAVLKFKTEEEAVRLANDNEFGLMACLWSGDAVRAMRVARQLRAGKVAVNGGGGFRSSAPMCGHKHSGIGTDLGLDEAVYEYTAGKTVLWSLSSEKCPWPE